jgi:transcriptional regulatory protein LevR/transcriptional regulator with AAA-type ATPase domain
VAKKDMIYNKVLEIGDERGIDTKTISSLVNMSRANVSHELNNLVREGKLYKSSGRPVLFFVAKSKTAAKKEGKLDQLVKNNISLKKVVEQMKAAILYPPKGLPSMLLGDTGTGKSMFASMMYEYSKEMSIRKKDSPFVVFNCADYSNNPNLLTSQLFGVKKGAFTGAEVDRVGLIEKANGGVLFLDELHRLPPEGQEILFTFLDTGYFRRIGDSETRKSDVLIISATTENPNSTLLRTFIRRIPIIIKIPSLKERTLEERLYLIKSFFKQESLRLNREIYVSLNTMRAFLSYDCPNNVGQLKSDVQLVCAKAYSEFLTNIKPDVRIRNGNLPLYIKEGLYKEKEHRALWNKLVGEEIEFFKFSSTIDHNQEQFENEDNGVYKIVEQKLERLKSQGISDIAIENILGKDISSYFQKHINGVSEEINKKNLLSIIGEEDFNLIDRVIYYMATELGRNFSGNTYTCLVLHIDTLINRVYNNKSITNPQLNKIKELYPKEFEIALKAKAIIENYVHHEIAEDEAAYLTIFLLPEDHIKNGNNKVKVILIAHGDSTATSMADVVNKLLEEPCVHAINAPLDLSPLKVLDELRKFVSENKEIKNYILLVDMGSLTTFADTIEKEFDVSMKAVPLVSTLHTLEAARKALIGLSLNEIYKSVLAVNSYFEMNKSLAGEEKNKAKVAIIVSCLSGEGGAIAIKSFLDNNLKYDKEIFEIIPLNCLDKKYFKQRINEIREEKEILFIVSSFSFDIDIKQYNMYDVINMNVMDEIQESINIKTTLIKMPMILKENIPNLDGEVLYNDISYFLGRVENELSIKLKSEKTIGIILHIAFMISKLKSGEVPFEYPDKDEFIDENLYCYNTIKECFIFLCNKYCVEISDNEICYVMRFFLYDPV